MTRPVTPTASMTTVSYGCTRCFQAKLEVGHMLMTGMDPIEKYLAMVKQAAQHGWVLSQKIDGTLEQLCPACVAAGPALPELPKFSDTGTCPKCGSEGFSLLHCVGGPPPACMANRAGEHMHRLCGRCGYNMTMKTKDHP